MVILCLETINETAFAYQKCFFARFFVYQFPLLSQINSIFAKIKRYLC